MKKILHIALDKRMGGIERFILNNYEKIDKTQYKFYFISSYSVPYIDEIKKLNGNVINVSSPIYILSYMYDLYIAIKKNNVDIVHVHKNSLANSIPIFVARMMKKQVIVHAHNSAIKNGGLIGKILHLINKTIIKNMMITKAACSPNASNFFWDGIEDVLLINNGIDYSNYQFNSTKRIKYREKLGIGYDDLVICNVGALIKQKNQKKLLSIVARLKEKNKKIKAVIIGDGELRQELETEIMRLNISNDVLLIGAVENVNDYLNAMDLFVMTSEYEGLPISALEAQANGLTVILPKNVDHNVQISENCFFCDKEDDYDSWCNLILNNISNGHLLTYIRKYADKYSVQYSSSQLEKIYGEF